MIICFFVVFVALLSSFTVRDTLYVPGLSYRCDAFLSVEFVPSPKSQKHETIFPSTSDELSMN